MLREQLEELSDEQLEEKYLGITDKTDNLPIEVQDVVLDVMIEILDILYVRDSHLWINL